MKVICSNWTVTWSGGGSATLLQPDDEMLEDLKHDSQPSIQVQQFLRGPVKTFHRGNWKENVVLSKVIKYTGATAAQNAYDFEYTHKIALRSFINGTLTFTRGTGTAQTIDNANFTVKGEVIHEPDASYTVFTYTVTGGNLTKAPAP